MLFALVPAVNLISTVIKLKSGAGKNSNLTCLVTNSSVAENKNITTTPKTFFLCPKHLLIKGRNTLSLKPRNKLSRGGFLLATLAGLESKVVFKCRGKINKHSNTEHITTKIMTKGTSRMTSP